MEVSYIAGLAEAAAEYFSASPGQAAWLQAVGSLIALLTVSLVPWLKGRSREQAFLLRGRILVQEADIILAEIERYLDLLGELEGQRYQISRIANEFRSFPVEELSRDVATAFHRCRVAFLNLVLTFEDLSPHEGILPPRPRMDMLRLVFTFQHAFEGARGTFHLRKNDKRKPSKTERAIQSAIDARKEDFETDWNSFLESRARALAPLDAAPTPQTDSLESVPT